MPEFIRIGSYIIKRCEILCINKSAVGDCTIVVRLSNGSHNPNCSFPDESTRDRVFEGLSIFLTNSPAEDNPDTPKKIK